MSDERPSEPPTAFNSADPPRNFSLPMEERIRAATIGPPAWAVRKRHIEDLEAKYVGLLRTLEKALVARAESAEAIRAALLAKASTFDLTKINTLIEKHNRYYPIEANLAMSRHGYLVFGRPWFPEEPWTSERFVEKALADAPSRTPA